MINKDKIFSELENRLFQARQALAILSEEIKILKENIKDGD
jgi:hypothetical protein|nr:MAG TPA: hypothetical protein [Bacteriophage sp.]